jgi:AcrR family transcriptional regulator
LELESGKIIDVAWDTDETRRRLQEAATSEFADHGLHGTTVNRIARRAGVNKERLYNYFGDKQALFDTVLTAELQKLADAASPVDYDDVGAFAGRTFDYYAEHPELARLLQWEGLADGYIADAERRTAKYRLKVERIGAAQRDGTLDDSLPPDHLAFLLIALSAWWHCVPQLAQMLTGADPSDANERARRRASVVAAARRLAAPEREPLD